jgi:hypothetical protein
VSHCPLRRDNSRYLKQFLPSFLFRRPDAGIDRRSCGASIGAKKVAGRMYPFGPKGPGAAVPGPSLFWVLAELGHSSFQIRPLVTQKLMATTDRQPTVVPFAPPLGTSPRRPQLTPQPRAEAVSLSSEITPVG